MALEQDVINFRHWPDDHPVVGDLLRRIRNDFRGAGWFAL